MRLAKGLNSSLFLLQKTKGQTKDSKNKKNKNQSQFKIGFEKAKDQI